MIDARVGSGADREQVGLRRTHSLDVAELQGLGTGHDAGAPGGAAIGSDGKRAVGPAHPGDLLIDRVHADQAGGGAARLRGQGGTAFGGHLRQVGGGGAGGIGIVIAAQAHRDEQGGCGENGNVHTGHANLLPGMNRATHSSLS